MPDPSPDLADRTTDEVRAGTLVEREFSVPSPATGEPVPAVLRRPAAGEGERLVREGRFDGWSPTMLLGMELRGRTLGIYGFGRIGRAVAERARGFGMSVIYCSRSERPGPPRKVTLRREPSTPIVSTAPTGPMELDW